MTQESRFHTLVEELKRRRVIRVATLYVVAMWPIIQIADILSPALNIPDTAMRSLLIVFIAGFPIALILTWVFNLTPKGLVKVPAVGDKSATLSEQSNERLIGKNAEIIVVGSLLLIAISLFFIQSSMDEAETLPIIDGTLSSAIEETTIESIAVLPFVPFSDNKQDEYFADGLSEELLNVLAKIKSLRVVARTSSFAYKGVNRNIQTVGKELGVDVILEGSVRRNDVNNTIRVTAQLIDVKTGSHLWSETYDRKFTDIFKIQDEITAAVVDELKITLLGEEKQQLLAHESASTDAMVEHSMGRTELAKRTAESILNAKSHFENAVRIDNGYATAFASLAEADILSISYSGKERDEARKNAQEAVDKALKIDPKLGLAWAAQGLIYYSDEATHKDAITALEKALKLNPSYAMANMWYGSLQEDEAKKIEYHEKAFRLDPKSPVAGYNVANNLILQGKDADAMEVFSQIIDADPYFPGAYILVAEISSYGGRIDQSIVQYKKAYELGEQKKIASTIARLYTRLLDVKNARHWASIAAVDATDKFKKNLMWLEAAILLAEDNIKEARDVLKTIAQVEKESWGDHFNTSRANYWLGDSPATVEQFELGEEKRNEENIERFLYSSVEVYLYASYAYKELEQHDKSDALIKIINEKLDAISTSGERVSATHWYQKALLQIIEGDQRIALITIQRAIDEGWSEPLTLAYEPMLEELKSDTNFRAMLAGLETRMNLMREQLAVEESFANHWKG